MKTVVDLATALKTYFLEKDTAAKQAVEATIAPVESDASSSAAAYSVGDQLILNDILYDVTASILISDALVVGTNIAAANDLSTQIGSKQDQIEVTSMPTASASNIGQVLIYIGATTSTYTSGQSYQSTLEGGSYIWKPTGSGAPTAAAVSYDGTQSGSSETNVQGAIDDLYSQKQTLETQVSAKADQSLLAPIQTTLVASKPYAIGEQFVYQGLLYKATTAIAQGGTITINGNCELSGDISQQLSNIQSGNEPITISVTTGNRYQTGNISFERPFDRAPVVICQLFSSSGGYLFQDFVWVTAATVNGFDYQVYESVANPSSHDVTLRYIAIGL